MKLVIVIFWIWASTQFNDVSHWLLEVSNDLDSQFIREISYYFMDAMYDGTSRVVLVTAGSLATIMAIVVMHNLLLMSKKNKAEDIFS